jgi:hypothetical protein
MQVAANLSAGVPELNEPYFRLYRENLANIEEWTRKHMAGRAGICIPETMRFNGQGIEYETWEPKKPIVGLNCDADSKPYYNARTISTGAEVSHWIWEQYLATGDREFLKTNYPLMAASARFLLAYEKPAAGDKDGLRHTSPSNAHETQWDTVDPVTDLAARAALYGDTARAARILGVDEALVVELKEASRKIPLLPRTEADVAVNLLTASSDDGGKDVIAASYVPAAKNENVENLGLEPLWPYDEISDASPLFDLAKRTYLHRPYPMNQDWSFDPIQAARLGLRDEVRNTLIQITEKYQSFVNGFANWGGDSGEFYVEQQGVVAAALQEALVQDYDGLIRIDPAFPHEWDVEGQVAVRGKTKVGVRTHGGSVVLVRIDAGTTEILRVRNPWVGKEVEVREVGRPVVHIAGETLEISVETGQRYLLSPAGAGRELESAGVASGSAAVSPKRLGPVQIGIFR